MIQTLPPNSGRNWGRTESVLRLAGTEVTKSLHTFELSKVLKTGREPRVLPDTCSNYHMDDCNLSFKFPAVPREYSVARSDYRRRQAGMLFSAAHPQARWYPIGNVGRHSSFLTFTTSGIPTSTMKLVYSKHRKMTDLARADFVQRKK